MTDELTSLDYADRQLLLVVSDNVAQAARAAEAQAVTDKQGVNWTWIGEIALKSLALPLSPVFTAPLIIELTHEAIKAWSRARDIGLNTKLVGKSQVKAVTFPPGHPRENILYVGHPTKATVYYTMADFHRMTFEHKFSEAVELLMALGATEISVHHVSGWSREFSGRINAPLGTSGLQAGIDVETSNEKGSELLFKATLIGTDAPTIPDNLAWLSHEPTWQTIARGRIKYGLLDFSLSVAYQDDFGVNAGLKLTASKAGLDLGGKFEDHESTIWSITGKFGPVRPSTKPQ
jgi:hypothetical protein